MYCYELELIKFSGETVYHYVKAQNCWDAFGKAHKFMRPDDPVGWRDIYVHRKTKKWFKDHHIKVEEV